MRPLSVLVLALLVGSCAPVVYTPGSQTLPMFDAAGQGSVGGSWTTNSFDVAAAWSPLSNVYVHASTSFEPRSIDSTDAFSFAEAGIGAYRRFGERTLVDVSAAYGTGHSSDYATEPIIPAGTYRAIHHEQSGDYRRLSGQAAIEVSSVPLDADPEVFRIVGAFVVRVSHVRFGDLASRQRLVYTAIDGSDSLSGWSAPVSRAASGTFLEPAFVVRSGIPLVMLEYRLGWSSELDEPDFDAVDLMMSLGLHLRIDRLLAVM